MHEFVTEWKVDKQHPSYDDHFPSAPVVPGALLIEWISQAIYMQYPTFQLKGIASFKFLQSVLPGDLLQFHFILSTDAVDARVECTRLNGVVRESVARGKLILAVKT